MTINKVEIKSQKYWKEWKILCALKFSLKKFILSFKLEYIQVK